MHYRSGRTAHNSEVRYGVPRRYIHVCGFGVGIAVAESERETFCSIELYPVGYQVRIRCYSGLLPALSGFVFLLLFSSETVAVVVHSEVEV